MAANVIYGITVITITGPNDGSAVPDVSTRVFTKKATWEQALEDLTLTDQQEVATFETQLE